MKHVAIALVCVAAFASAFAAAPSPIPLPFPIIVNGRSFASAQFVNGKWAVSLQDFSKAFGGTLTLEPDFQLQGNRLSAAPVQHKHLAGVKYEDITISENSGKSKAAPNPNAGVVQKAGVISNDVFLANGKAWVPLADVVRAFGATFTAPPANHAPLTIGGSGGILGFNR